MNKPRSGLFLLTSSCLLAACTLLAPILNGNDHSAQNTTQVNDATVLTETQVLISTPPPTVVKETQSTSPTPRNDPTATTIQPTITALPTIPAPQVQDFVKGLFENNRGCRLPCMWGITPGETSWLEAKQFLDTFATTGWSERYQTGDAYVSPPINADHIGSLWYQFPVTEGLVDGIETYHYDFPQLDAWYYLWRILDEYGPPDQVGLYTDGEEWNGSRPTGLIVFYADFGALIHYVSFHEIEAVGDHVRICPDGTYNLMFLWAPEAEISYEDALEMYIDNEIQGLPEPRPLAEVSDMDVQSFYEMFKDSNDACIETPLEHWPNFLN